MNNLKEIWKDVAGYEGLYKVSNLGEVKSLKRINRLGRTVNEKILSKAKTSTGYYTVALYKNNTRKMKFIHRLVAESFIANPNNYPCVNHKKEFEITNNTIDNLEWCTYSYNNNYGTKVERIAEKQSMEVYQYSEDKKTYKKVGICK